MTASLGILVHQGQASGSTRRHFWISAVLYWAASYRLQHTGPGPLRPAHLPLKAQFSAVRRVRAARTGGKSPLGVHTCGARWVLGAMGAFCVGRSLCFEFPLRGGEQARESCWRENRMYSMCKKTTLEMCSCCAKTLECTAAPSD